MVHKDTSVLSVLSTRPTATCNDHQSCGLQDKRTGCRTSPFTSQIDCALREAMQARMLAGYTGSRGSARSRP